MKNTSDKKNYRRLLAVIQKSNGRTFEDITKEHGVSIRTVQRWISAYLKTGTKGLEIKKPGGTQFRITDEDRGIMLSVLFNDPNIFGYIRNTWSLRSLAKCLREEFGITINQFQTSSRHYNQFQTSSKNTKRYRYCMQKTKKTGT